MDGRFTRIDERFTAIDGKFEETKRYFGVLAEGLRSDIRQVAEGHHILVDGQARIVEKIEYGFQWFQKRSKGFVDVF